MRAQLYEAFSRLRFTPSQVDEMEAWQAAAILGVGKDDAQMRDISERMAREKDTLAERAAKVRERSGRDHSEPTDDITSEVMRQMGIVLPPKR